MTVTDRMLKLLDASLHGLPAEPVSSGEWHELLEEMRKQTVAYIPTSKLDELGLSMDVQREYMAETGTQLKNYHLIMREQSRVADMLENAGIGFAVIKGSAAAVNYPHPEFRTFGDIDIIVHKQDFEKAFDVFCENGYLFDKEPKDHKRHVTFCSQEGIHTEMHDRFALGPDEKRNDMLDRFIDNGIDRREYVNIDRYRMPTLPLIENGVVLLAHIQQHLARGIGLRQIIDWMCYAEKYQHSDPGPGVENALEDLGLKNLAVTVTALCEKYLGLKCDAGWFVGDADDATVDELMDYILARGNFGRNDTVQRDTVDLIRKTRDPVSALRFAQECGRRTWKALERHPWLRPFAWIYQVVRWSKHGRARGVSVMSVGKYADMEDHETILLGKLGVTGIPGRD